MHLAASHRGGNIVIEIRDDGRGLPRDKILAKAAAEIKTKPTQHSVKELRSIGIAADVILARCEREISDDERAKIALFTNVPKEAVILALDARSRASAEEKIRTLAL